MAASVEAELNSAIYNPGRQGLRPMIDPADLPPLPEFRSEAIRTQVFTHRSFHARPTRVFEDAPFDPAPDNEKLEHLGDSVLSLVVTCLMRELYPDLRVGPSTKIRALVVGNPTLASISVMYRLPERLRMHPAQAITLRASVNIQADLFEAFVGGLFQDSGAAGLDVVQAWLHPLFRPYIAEAYRIIRVQHGLPPERSPREYGYASDHSTSSSSGSSTPTLSSPAPAPTVSIGHLSLFNQHLQQQGKAIEWVYSDSLGQGTRTTPIWVVRAMLGEDCIGRGRGSTKKAAKNEAAKEGLQHIGISVSTVRRRSLLALRSQHILSRLGPDALSRRSWSSCPGVKRMCMGLLSRLFLGRLRRPMLYSLGTIT